MSCLITKDWRLSTKTVLLYVRAACALERGFNTAAESWRKNAGRLGNANAWRKYLAG
ncbi:MAG: hypothetical protein LUH55_02100 [Bacteroides thetaiotaomicron]|nr:hypothetical protein [Bacteroides thetaiotaomicron]